jgi:hypothetical protein
VSKKRPESFVSAFRCKKCGKIILNSAEMPKSNEVLDQIKDSGKLEAHTKILEHSRDEHNGEFIDMYQALEMSGPELEKTLKSEEVSTV